MTSLSLTADGRRAVTTCADRVVRLWDVGHAVLLKSQQGKENETFNTADFSPDARWIVTTSTIDETRTAAAMPRVRRPPPTGPARRQVRDMSCASAMRRAWMKSAGKQACPRLLANVNSGKTDAGTGQGATIWTAIFTPRSDGLLTVGGDEACLWDIATGRQKMVFSRQGAVASARFSPDGKHVITSSWDKAVRIWNVRDRAAGAEARRPYRFGERRGLFTGRQLHRHRQQRQDGDPLGCRQRQDPAHLQRSHGSRLPRGLVQYGRRFKKAAYGIPGRNGANLGRPNRTDSLHPGRTPQASRILRGRLAGWVADPYGRRRQRGDSLVAENNRADERFRLEGHTAAVTSVAFSPDASRSYHRQPRQYGETLGIQGGKELMTLKGHSQEVTTVAFSTDGKTVSPAAPTVRSSFGPPSTGKRTSRRMPGLDSRSYRHNGLSRWQARRQERILPQARRHGLRLGEAFRKRLHMARITVIAKWGVSWTMKLNCLSFTGTTLQAVFATAVALRGD